MIQFNFLLRHIEISKVYSIESMIPVSVYPDKVTSWSWPIDSYSQCVEVKYDSVQLKMQE